MGTILKNWVLFFTFFLRQFGPITLILPGAKLQLICLYMVQVAIS